MDDIFGDSLAVDNPRQTFFIRDNVLQSNFHTTNILQLNLVTFIAILYVIDYRQRKPQFVDIAKETGG